MENSTQFVFTVRLFRLCLLHRQQGQWREKEGRGRGRRDGEDGLHFQEVCDLENEGKTRAPFS